MRLTRLRSTCPDTESCPSLYWTDRDTAVLQGAVVVHPEAFGARPLAAGEAVVEVPAALLEGLTISGPTLYATEHGTVLVFGSVVADAEALATLRLPIGETAVEVWLGRSTILIKQEARS